jgi:SEC-C motif-containing protein
MREVERNDRCPCGSGLKYKKCCLPYHDLITWPPTPEALMRSRFTAYVVGHAQHLYRTTHPDNPAVKDISQAKFVKETTAYCQEVDFVALTIHGTWETDETTMAQVEFTAEYIIKGEAGAFSERSNFVELGGRWVYHSGREV